MSGQACHCRLAIRSGNGNDVRFVRSPFFKPFQGLREHFDFAPDRNTVFFGKWQYFFQFNIRAQSGTDGDDIELFQPFRRKRPRHEPAFGNQFLQLWQPVRVFPRIGNANARLAIRAPARHCQSGLTESQHENFFACPVHII